MANEVTVGDEVPPKCELIEVHVAELSLLFNAMDPSPPREKDLDPQGRGIRSELGTLCTA
jgi:hypothetical protein